MLTTPLTCDSDARLPFVLSRGEDIKEAAVAAFVIRPQLLDGDVAGVVVRSGELHVGVLMAETHRDALLVRQQNLVVPVVPAHLPDDFARFCCDVTGQQQRATCLCTEAGRSCDLT